MVEIDIANPVQTDSDASLDIILMTVGQALDAHRYIPSGGDAGIRTYNNKRLD